MTRGNTGTQDLTRMRGSQQVLDGGCSALRGGWEVTAQRDAHVGIRRQKKTQPQQEGHRGTMRGGIATRGGAVGICKATVQQKAEMHWFRCSCGAPAGTWHDGGRHGIHPGDRSIFLLHGPIWVAAPLHSS
jgi:hypothetical protein